MSSTTIAQPRAVLICRSNSHPFQDRTVGLDQSVKIGRSVARSRPNLTNAIFDCKVLSRNHALLWYETGKFFLQDTKSSNGTFINNQRLSKSSEESPPREVSSGDIVQFGVDVMEVTKKVTHGCIVATLQLFLPDGKEAKASSSTLLADKGTTTSVQEIYQLNQYIQDALHREQLIETKLASMNQLLLTTKEGVDTSWKALIEEDRLLTRVDILERQLEVSHKSMNEDKLRNEVVQLHEDKEKYQTIAKEILRKAVQEKMDSIVKYHDLELNLASAEQERELVKELYESGAVELSCMAAKYEEAEKRTKELVQELSQSTEKYKEELENLNQKLKGEESLLADKQKVIDALRLTVDLQVTEKMRDALSRSDDGRDDDSVPMNGTESGQGEMGGDKCAIRVEELKDQLKQLHSDKSEIYKRTCQLVELFDNLKAVSNKIQVSEYLVELIGKVDAELKLFRAFTQTKAEDMDQTTVYDFDSEKVEEELRPFSRVILTEPVETTGKGSPVVDSETHGDLVTNRSMVYEINYLQAKIHILQELLAETREELRNGASHSEVQDLTLKLTDSANQLDYSKMQVTALTEVNGELVRRMELCERESRSMEQRVSFLHLELSAKSDLVAASETTIKELRDEVSALKRDSIPPPQPQQSPHDLRKENLDETTQTAEEASLMGSFQDDSPSNHTPLATKLLEAEEELAIYKEQYLRSSSECWRLERKIEEQAALGNNPTMNVLRYVVPLLIFILAILIAFHPSS